MAGFLHCLLWVLFLVGQLAPGHVASSLLETSLEAYTSRSLEEWSPPDVYSAAGARLRLPDFPYVWTDGSLVREEVSGCCSGGAGVYAHVFGSAWIPRSWGHLDFLPVDADTGVECCRLFSSVPGPLQSVQRAEVWSVILALQSSKLVNLGVDNLKRGCVTFGALCLACSDLWWLRGALVLVPSLRLKVMLMMTWFAEVGFAGLTRLVMTRADEVC